MTAANPQLPMLVPLALATLMLAALPTVALAQSQKLVLPSEAKACGKFIAVKGYERCNSIEKPRELDPANAELQSGEWLGINCGDGFDDKALAVVAEIPELQGLFGSFDLLTDEGFKQAEKLVNLRYLRLIGADKLTAKGFAHLKAAKEMRSVAVSFSEAVNDSWLDVLEHWPELRELEVDNTPLTGAGFRSFAHTPKLQWLAGWNMYKLTDTAIEHIIKLPALTGLHLDGCKHFTSEAVRKLKTCAKLNHLRLSDCQAVTDKEVAELCQLQSLQELDFSRCKNISDEAVSKIAALTKLQELSLSHCELLTDIAVQSISNLTGLKRLRLGGCPKFTEACLDHVLKLEKLESMLAPTGWSQTAKDRLKKARPNIVLERI